MTLGRLIHHLSPVQTVEWRRERGKEEEEEEEEDREETVAVTVEVGGVGDKVVLLDPLSSNNPARNCRLLTTR